MKDLIINKEITEKAVLVGLITPSQPEVKTKEYLDELAFLADTAGAETVCRFTQKVEWPNPRTYVGKGKLEEIRQYVQDNEIGMVIFDDDLSTKQVSNIERELQVKILDRTSLILDIFAKRAQTANAKTQVELAQYQYLLPRLTRMWTHLERQRGGIGMRGPGETQILVLGQFDLGLRIGCLRALCKYVENKACTVENLNLQFAFKIGHLLGRKVIVEYYESYAVFLDILLYFFKFAFPYECTWVGIVDSLEKTFLGDSTGCIGEEREFVEIFVGFGFRLLRSDKSYEHGALRYRIGDYIFFHNRKWFIRLRADVGTLRAS